MPRTKHSSLFFATVNDEAKTFNGDDASSAGATETRTSTSTGRHSFRFRPKISASFPGTLPRDRGRCRCPEVSASGAPRRTSAPTTRCTTPTPTGATSGELFNSSSSNSNNSSRAITRMLTEEGEESAEQVNLT